MARPVTVQRLIRRPFTVRLVASVSCATLFNHHNFGEDDSPWASAHAPVLREGLKSVQHFSFGECRIKELIMSDRVKFWFNAQAGYDVDTGRHKKIRVVFGMIDEDKTSMAWYLFSSDGDA